MIAKYNVKLSTPLQDWLDQSHGQNRPRQAYFAAVQLPTDLIRICMEDYKLMLGFENSPLEKSLDAKLSQNIGKGRGCTLRKCLQIAFRMSVYITLTNRSEIFAEIHLWGISKQHLCSVKYEFNPWDGLIIGFTEIETPTAAHQSEL